MVKYGFIGTGNMGGALARAICKRVAPHSVALADHDIKKAQALAGELGCGIADNRGIAAECDFIFLGVKPQMMAGMLSEIADIINERGSSVVLVTMAAGLSIADISAYSGGAEQIIRIMPNIPVQVGEGMILCCGSEALPPEKMAQFTEDMSGAGRIVSLPEGLIDAGSAVSGCGPAFIAMFIEALADGGVSCGLPRSTAIELAAQTVSGTARLILEGGMHPAELKDAVCSPGGTTIAGVLKLEENSFRSSVSGAAVSAYEKTLRLREK